MSITLKEYVFTKRGFTNGALSKGEANILCIPYPLESGWLKIHGPREIDDKTLHILLTYLKDWRSKKTLNQNKNKKQHSK